MIIKIKNPFYVILAINLLAQLSVYAQTPPPLWLEQGETQTIAEKSVAKASVAMSSGGQVAVAWSEKDSSSEGFNLDIYVKHFDGESWKSLGGPLDMEVGRFASSPAVVLGIVPNPIVAWSEEHGEGPSLNTNVYVKRWTGEAWEQLGEALDADVSKRASEPKIVIDKRQHPVVAWRENSTHLFVKRWDGSAWEQIGEAVNTWTSWLDFALALDKEGNPFLAFGEPVGPNNDDVYVKNWNGSTWEKLGGALDSKAEQFAGNPSLVIDSAGNPVVVWQEKTGLEEELWTIFVKRWDGSAWGEDKALNTNVMQSAEKPSIAIDSTGSPVVVWQGQLADGDGTRLYVKRWHEDYGEWLEPFKKSPFGTANAMTNPIIASSNASLQVLGWLESRDTSTGFYLSHFQTIYPNP